jgi:hypothetical protein
MRLRSAIHVQHSRALDQFAKPCALGLGIAREIEDDGDSLRQESANVWRKRVLQSRRTLEAATIILTVELAASAKGAVPELRSQFPGDIDP